MPSTKTLQGKLAALRENLAEMSSILVAFSGGVDSSFLLKIASEVLGSEPRLLAVTIYSEVHPTREIAEARDLGREFGVPHEIIKIKVLDIPGFKDNPPDRCYLCKKNLFSMLKEMAVARGLACVVDGSNSDDSGDYRPGMAALAELGIRSPLKEAGLTKHDIRVLSKGIGLTTWNKPARACLATRFPYGVEITEGKLHQVEAAEDFLRDMGKDMGLRDLRVRHHGDIARIEISKDETTFFLEKADTVVAKLKELGYVYVTLDLEGYRMGSMNLPLTTERRKEPKRINGISRNEDKDGL
ncbi:MAG: ATP-dependent sacrificial sulfur transferase LarE [Firmicutes bacterium]|nr:ATP-dependent sacrificial sulfur transferase LarE [Bacillota bacterium]